MKKRIVLYGDSNTWGYISGSDSERFDEDTRWSCLLEKELGDDYAVIEEGQCGRTTVWTDPIENRMSGLDYLWPCLDTHRPVDLLVIMLGTNNLKTYYANGPWDIAESVKTLAEVAMSSKFGPGKSAPKILIVSPIEVKAVPHEPSFGPSAEEKSKLLAKWYEKAASDIGASFLDAAKHAWPDMADGLHMARECHAPFAAAMAGKIREILM